MKENFNKIIESIKEDTLNQKETKEYILAIKRVIKEIYENCKDEENQEDIIADFLEEYEKDLGFRGNAEIIYSQMLKYISYKRVAKTYKENKKEFKKVFSEATTEEMKNGRETIRVSKEVRKSMVAAVRNIIRTKQTTKPQDILKYIEEEKDKLEQELRVNMINILHPSISFLEEYGFIDEYIDYSNKELEEMGLKEFRYEKRNPIADEQYDEKGNLVYDVEDIGVIDTFSEENLQNYSVEDLAFLTAFWESKYFQERVEVSKSMSVIKSLNLWDVMLHEEDKAIYNIDPERINAALKRDIAITSLARNKSKITSKMERQYIKFAEKYGIDSRIGIEDVYENEKSDIENLNSTSNDIVILEGLLLELLNSKSIKIDSWGVVENLEAEIEDDLYMTTIAIDNKNFRGPLLVAVTKDVLKNFLGEDAELPVYKKELNKKYCNVMAYMFLPANNYFRNSAKKAYKEEPNSQILADLAGVKVKSGNER